MLKHLISLLLLALCSSQLLGQDFSYKPLQSSGELPKELLTSSTQKYERAIRTMSLEEEGLTESDQKRFYLETNFRIDGLLQSGKVLFNDPIGIYINQVVDEILKGQEELRSKLKFFVVKSPFPNAFTTNDGIILVNVGLLSRMETEAQLAYILCHEIAHYQAKHVIKGYALSISLEDNDQMTDLSDLDKLLMKNNYSRENERMADSLGFELFRQTAYSGESLPQVFDLLKTAHEPYLFPRAPFSILENPYWHPDFTPPQETEKKETPAKKTRRGDGFFVTGFEKKEGESSDSTASGSASPDSVDSKNIGVIEPVDPIEIKLETGGKAGELEKEQKRKSGGSDSPFATHPSPLERKDQLLAQMKGINTDMGSSFVVSPEAFIRCKRLAAYESCRMFLLDAAYFDALYQAMCLQEDEGKTMFLSQLIFKSLYGISKYRSNGRMFPRFIDYDNLPDGLTHFQKLFNKKHFKGEEYMMLAISHAKHHMDTYPQDSTCNMYVQDLVYDLLEKYPDWEQQDGGAEKAGSFEPYAHAIHRMMADDKFRELYDKAQKRKERKENFEAFQETFKGRNEIRNFERKSQRTGRRLGIDKVVVFSPFYYLIDEREEESSVKFLDIESEEENMKENMLRSARKLKLDVTLLDAHNLTAGASAESFNDIMLANEWYADFLQHGSIDMVSIIQEEMAPMVQKYGTPYFVNMGSVALREYQIYQTLRGVGIMVLTFGTATPWAIYRFSQRSASSLSYAMVMDVEKGRVVMFQRHFGSDLNKGPRLHAFMHYYLWQIKRKKKK